MFPARRVKPSQEAKRAAIRTQQSPQKAAGHAPCRTCTVNHSNDERKQAAPQSNDRPHPPPCPNLIISLSHYLIISLCPDFIDRKLKTPATDSSIFSSHGQWPMKKQKVAAGSILSHGNIGPQADTWVVYHTPHIPHIPHIPRPLTSGFWGKGNQADQKLPRG